MNKGGTTPGMMCLLVGVGKGGIKGIESLVRAGFPLATLTPVLGHLTLTQTKRKVDN